MSKTTKIVAALGIVAGLGVAALPSFTYATQVPQTITGDVDVIVEVQPAIAMTITGNNDNGAQATTVSYTAVADPTGNPSESGYYERTGDAGSYIYTASTDTEVASGKTYYTQDAAKSYAPVANFAPSGIADQTLDGYSVPATATLGTSSSYTEVLPNATVTGAASNGFRSTITVYTNAAGGYTLTLKDKDTDNALTNVNGATIPATSATSLTAGTAAWGYKVFSTGGNHEGAGATETGDTDWLAVPISTGTAATIRTKDTKTSGGDQTIVDYGAATAADQATGIYGDVIVYTATTR